MKTFNDILEYIERIGQYLANRYNDALYMNQDGITRTLELMSDSESKEVYCREIVFCIIRNFLGRDLASTLSGGMSATRWKMYNEQVTELGIHPEMECISGQEGALIYNKAATFILNQYKYKDKVVIKNDDICLDIGGCMGDTTIWMLDNGAKHVYTFEIDKRNLEIMHKNFTNTGYSENVTIIAKAATPPPPHTHTNRGKGTVWYLPDGRSVGCGKIFATQPNNNAAYEVETTTVDEICAEYGIVPDFVKMDIEGAEPGAIIGATNTFRQCRPRFAICIYHKWEHRWEIPLQIAELCPEYEFYVKKSHPTVECVLLGRPKEQREYYIIRD